MPFVLSGNLRPILLFICRAFASRILVAQYSGRHSDRDIRSMRGSTRQRSLLNGFIVLTHTHHRCLGTQSRKENAFDAANGLPHAIFLETWPPHMPPELPNVSVIASCSWKTTAAAPCELNLRYVVCIPPKSMFATIPVFSN